MVISLFNTSCSELLGKHISWSWFVNRRGLRALKCRVWSKLVNDKSFITNRKYDKEIRCRNKLGRTSLSFNQIGKIIK